MNWICLLVLLSTASSVLCSNDCSKPEWWKNTVIYQILVPSFKDSNGDGIGDLRGIIENVGYLKDLGVETLWLTPFYSGPNKDIGYDISNYLEVGKDFGNMADFEELVKVVHSKGMKILIEFVPNHSSSEHDWFRKSAQKQDPYTNYYVWKKATEERKPPNNWLSKRSGSMWKFHDLRQEYYLHQFLDELPDLNYRSEDLVKEMNATLEFWLKKGVDGFGMDSVLKLYEDDSWADEPKLPGTQLGDTDPNAYDHKYTLDQPDTYEMLYKWRSLVDKFSTPNQPRVIITEAYSPSLDKVAKYYGTTEKPGTHLSVNYEIMNKFGPADNAKVLVSVIDNYMKSLPAEAWSSWMVGGHSVKRIASRYPAELVDALNMLTLLLPGTAVTFAGDEIGMESPFIRYEDQRDPEGYIFGKDKYLTVCRDGSRIPFQWNSKDNAGFSNSQSWLPVHSNYWAVNVQAEQKDTPSHLSVYKDLTTLRATSRAVRLGSYSVLSIRDGALFILHRFEQQSSVYTVINFNSRSEVLDANEIDNQIKNDDKVEIYTASVNAGFNKRKIDWSDSGSRTITLRPYAAVVIAVNHNANTCARSGASTLLPACWVLLVSFFYVGLCKLY